jgi:hypothetical protein
MAMEDQLKASDNELVIIPHPSHDLSVPSQAEASSTDLATLPAEQTTGELALFEHIQTPKITKTRTDISTQPSEKSSENDPAYAELARYYWLMLLMGQEAIKFVGSGSGGTTNSAKTNHRTKRAAPANKEVQLAKSRSAATLSNQPWTSSQWTPLFNTMRQEGFSTPGDEVPKTASPESKEVKMYGEANSLLNTLAEEKYGVASWTQLGPDEQKRIRSRALAQLHPDRGGDPALYQQVESMIMSQPLTAPLKGRPEDDIANTEFITEPSSDGSGGNETPSDHTDYNDSFEAPVANPVVKTPLAIEAAPTPLALDPAPTFDAIEAAPTKPAIEAAPIQKVITSDPAPTNQG